MRKRPSDGASDAARRVADVALARSADAFAESALDAAAWSLLDTLGVAIAATDLDAARIARETALALFGAGRPDLQARLLFDGRAASLPGAAFAAASQIDNLDAHDGYNPTKGHIGVVAVPALAGLAEAEPTLSGREALATLVVGYEIAGRAGIALHATASDYHTSGAWNALGVAAMAARRRGMGAAGLRDALGIAEYHGPRSQMMREIANPTMLHDGSCWGALTGLSAAILAESGFTGAPAITVEAPEIAHLWADLGAVWTVETQYIKPYPICRWAHAAMDAARELRAEHGFAAAEIAHVRVGAFAEAVRLFAGAPETTSQAQYSLHFALAAMLVHGEVGVAQITGEALSDPSVLALLSRIEAVEDPHYSGRFPAERWSDLEITLRGGRVLRSGAVLGRGEPARPLSREAIREKFVAYAEPVLGAARTEAIVRRVGALIEPQSRFADLAALLYDPPRAL